MFHVKQMRKWRWRQNCSTWNRVLDRFSCIGATCEDKAPVRQRNSNRRAPLKAGVFGDVRRVIGAHPKNQFSSVGKFSSGPPNELLELSHGAGSDDLESIARGSKIRSPTANCRDVIKAELANHLVEKCKFLRVWLDQRDIEGRSCHGERNLGTRHRTQRRRADFFPQGA